MYAVGSSDERSDDSARIRGAELAEHTGLPVEVVFATKLGENAVELHAALVRLRAAGAQRIVGLPIFCPPVYSPSGSRHSLTVLSPPLADHPDVISAIIVQAVPLFVVHP